MLLNISHGTLDFLIKIKRPFKVELLDLDILDNLIIGLAQFFLLGLFATALYLNDNLLQG